MTITNSGGNRPPVFARTSVEVGEAVSRKKAKGGLLTIGQALLLVCALVIFLGTATAGLIYFVSDAIKRVEWQSSQIVGALRNQLTADMYHDTLRGVVYKALYASAVDNPAAAGEARSEMVEYSEAFRAAIAEQATLDLPADVRLVIASLQEPLDAYIAQATSTVDLIGRGDMKVAIEAVPSFAAAFDTLETSMANASAAIETANEGAFMAASDIVTLSAFASAAVMLLALFSAGTVWLLGRRHLSGSLSALGTSIRRLADGDLDVSVDRQQAITEIGTIAEATDAFRANAAKVALLSQEQKGFLAAAADAAGQLRAISRSQAVIEFTPEGEILTANPNFCATLGYALEEIKGRHHRMFVHADEASSPGYRELWASLARGEHATEECLRIGKGGKQVWIQASYNPILDLDGRVVKVVKYAIDITGRKRAVNELGTALARLAEGDLRSTIPTAFEGELEEVRTAFNHTIERVSGIVSQLRTTSGSLKTATGEILSGANDLADRTTKQAAAIEETLAAMEQLATTVAENATRAGSASTKALGASRTAEETVEVMKKSNEAMERISSSSSKISSIIGLIDDIAFQTNLLALNASVEAARAGDAGKGFAVVAVEVRRLAQSAARASSDVKALIEQSANEVRGGTSLVSEAAQKLNSMLDGVRESASLVKAIASASQEQSGGIAEVTTAIRQMDEITQHNAALVEETNAAIEQTEAQATELDKVVDVFLVDASPVGAPANGRSVRIGRAA